MPEPQDSGPLSAGKSTHLLGETDSGSAGGEPSAAAEYGENSVEREEGRAELSGPDIPAEVPLWKVLENAKCVCKEDQKSKAWKDATETVQKYSDDMIKRWKEEIDNYLTFAGLFSAVLTTFNVQSYLLLQPTPPDPSIAVLQHISSQLASFSLNPPFINSTQPSSSGGASANPPSPIPRWAVWLNSLWFSGLILSLASASVGIMVKQWLNEYSSGVSGNSRSVSQMRQYRLNHLRTWHVEDVVNTIPVLLQLALAFFLSGLLVLLWNLHDTVAAVASMLVGLLGVFIAATTFLPLFHHQCSYRTPQIRAIDSLWQPKLFAYCISKMHTRLFDLVRER